VAFVKFAPETKKSVSARASINPKGLISFTEQAVAAYNVKSYGFATLYYDAGRNAIGIELSKSKGDGAKKLLSRGNRIAISAADFRSHFGIDNTATLMVDLVPDEKSRLLVMNLGAAKARAPRGSK
jgi:hypothetical protein